MGLAPAFYQIFEGIIPKTPKQKRPFDQRRFGNCLCLARQRRNMVTGSLGQRPRINGKHKRQR
jgi:hypothetical protein